MAFKPGPEGGPEMSGDTPEDHNPETKINRRGFFRSAALALGGAAFASRLEGARDPLRNIEKKPYPTGPWAIRRWETQMVKQGNKFVKKRVPVRVKFGGILSEYTGIEGEVPDVAHVDFAYQLASMWEHKKRISNNDKVSVLGRELVKEYIEASASPERMSLKNYQTEIVAVMNEVLENLDWSKLDSIRHISSQNDQTGPRRLKLLRQICSSVKSVHMTAYALTELMPTFEGSLNVGILEYLLKSGGEKYLQSTPALNDGLRSFGVYQLSQQAVYDSPHAGTHQDLRGASIINRALKHGKIPGDISKIRGADHHKAAYLFMIYNFSRLVNSLNLKQLGVLERRWDKRENDMVGFAATAHHGEAEALKAAYRWLDNGAGTDFWHSCNGTYTIYGKKTKINLLALREKLGTHGGNEASYKNDHPGM